MFFTAIGVFLAFVFVLLGLVIIALGLRSFGKNETQRRIQSFVISSHDTLETRTLAELQNREFTESLLQRTILPWLNTIISFLGRFTPEQTIQETQRRLMIAGNPFNLKAPQYYGLRLLFLMMGLLVSFLIFQSNASPPFLLLAALTLLLFLMLPSVWLTSTMRRRQDMIRRGLPDSLEMLSVCVAAGLSFDQALLRVGQTFKTAIGAEFSRVVSEMEVGVSRRQALRNLQVRVDISELSSFVAIVLQAEALGMGIAEVLSAQAEQMRIYRHYRAKELAQQLPAKMMIPLAAFIFPALLAVILGPTVPKLIQLLGQ